MVQKIFTDESLETFVDKIKSYTDDAASKKANTSHTHSIANVTNLQSTLDGKASSSHTHSYLPLSGGNLTGALGVGNKYELSPAYNYTNGCLINIGAAKSSTMVAIHITGNSYNSSTHPIDSLFQFYDYGDGTIMNYSGVNLGLSLGTMTVYRYNNRLYAYIKQTASYQTLSFTIITNKSGLTPTIENAAAHTSGYTDLVTIAPKNVAFDGHTHNYAGSSSAGGSATSAVKLDTSTAGSATQPVYFSGGKPVACTYTLSKSVPSNAVFTDTNTQVTNTLATTTKAYVTGTTSANTNTGTQVFDTGVYLDTTAGQLTAAIFNGSTFKGSGVATLAEVKTYLGI